MPIVYGKRRALRLAYRMAGYRNAGTSRRRYGYMQRNSFNRRVVRNANRISSALAIRGWIPGGVIEKKYSDTSTTNTAVSTTAGIACLNQLAQGTSATTRVGGKIVVRSIQVKGIFRLEQAVDEAVSILAPAQAARFMIILDKQPNGVLATAAEIFESSADVFSPINMANRARFVVLTDKLFALGPSASTSGAGVITWGSGTQKIINWYKKCRIPVEYGGNSGLMADIKTNAIILVLMGQIATGDTDTNFSGYTRIRYQDA